VRALAGAAAGCVLAATPSASHPDPYWTAEAQTGGAAYLPSTLRIAQSGEDDLSTRGSYDSGSFEQPLYYALRLTRWNDGAGWGAEFIHLKLRLVDPPAEIQQFDISHGLNHFLVNRAWLVDSWVLQAGAGLVLAHPENDIRGQRLSEHGGVWRSGYYFTGPAFLVSAGRRFDLGQDWFATVEAKATAARVRVPVADGRAELWAAAGHLAAGLGAGF
jgi:hypothetical protein